MIEDVLVTPFGRRKPLTCRFGEIGAACSGFVVHISDKPDRFYLLYCALSILIENCGIIPCNICMSNEWIIFKRGQTPCLSVTSACMHLGHAFTYFWFLLLGLSGIVIRSFPASSSGRI